MSCGLRVAVVLVQFPFYVLSVFCFCFVFILFLFFFACSQAPSTVRILALCKSCACLPHTPNSCPAKRINGADNGRATWRLWEMSKENGRGRSGVSRVYSGKIPSINKSAAKFLSTRVAVDNAALSIFPHFSQPAAPSFPSLPFPVFRFPSLQAFPDSCWLCNIIALFLLTHAAVRE